VGWKVGLQNEKNKMAAKVKLEILYEDDYVVAVNKPAGYLSIPDRFIAEIPNVKGILESTYGEIFTVHRIDKYTSGVMIFAKDSESHKYLSAQWMDRKPEKYYTAIVDGVPSPESDIIDLSLAESMTRRGKMVANKRGKESMTKYQVIENYVRFSLLELQIYTGRMHQIRVHMAQRGYPLVVDSLYGKREALMLSELKGKKYRKPKDEEERPLLSRQPLHAHKLVISHPHTQQNISIEAPLPKDMRAVINQMRKLKK